MPTAKHVTLVIVAFLVLLLFGVWFLEAKNSRPETVDRSATPPTPAISIAKFSDAGIPNNCADVIFSAHKEIAVEKLQARGFVLLKSTCKETFSRLPALASCTRSDADEDAQPPTHGVGYYYDVATLEGDDTYRGQCLGTGGTWAQDDPQYASARSRMGASTPHHEDDSLMELMH
jgi:hypothetical protein